MTREILEQAYRLAIETTTISRTTVHDAARSMCFMINSSSKPFTCSRCLSLQLRVLYSFVLAHCTRDSNSEFRGKDGIVTAAILPATKSGGKTLLPEKRP